jgi:hypothetical protein
MENLRSKKVIAYLGLICLFLGTILPCYEITMMFYSQKIILLDYSEGLISILLIIITLLFICRNILEKKLPKIFKSNLGKYIKRLNEKVILFPTFLIIVLDLHYFNGITVSSKYISYLNGYYLLLIGSILILIHAFFYKKKTKRGSINKGVTKQMKEDALNNISVIDPHLLIQQVMMEKNIKDNLDKNTTQKYCTNCGQSTNVSDTCCPKCGYKF